MKKKQYIIFRIIAAVCLFLMASVMVSAQNTKVKGRVTDAETGEGIPFVGVYFQNTQIGVTTDLEGYYSLETRELETDILVAFLMGYEPESAKVKMKSYNQIDFQLKSTSDLLDASLVMPDDRHIQWILSQIDKNREKNDPDQLDRFDCNVYNKMELDLTNPEKNLRGKAFYKRFGFVFDYIDTSAVSGKPYLPVLMSESVSRRYHVKEEGMDREVIQASQISGLNPENALSHLTGSLKMKINFYDNFVKILNLDLPSPVSRSGSLYYNYYLIDSLQVDQRKTYKIRFHPKKYVSTPSFDGEMSVDAEDFALREMNVKLDKGTNVNWLRDLVIDVENEKIGDSVWFYKNERLYADVAVNLSDSSNLVSLFAHRDLTFYDLNLETKNHEEVMDQGYSEVLAENANRRSEEYWEEIRPYPLSQNEKNIYSMVERVKQVPAYKNIYNVVNMISGGYWELGKIGLGPYDQLTSYNNLEGRRFQLGVRTTKELSRKFRFTGVLGYGLKDHKWKGRTDFEFIFSNPPMRKLFLRARVEMKQLGKGTEAFAETNMLSNLFAKGGGGFVKKSQVDEFSARYEHEFNSNITNKITLETQRIHGNDYVPMIQPDGTLLHSVAANTLRYSLRFSWDESVTRGIYKNQYLYTKYPVLTLDLQGGVKGLWKHDYNFLRTEATMNYQLQLPPLGSSKIRLNAGKIFGKVPYPFLKLHEGNATYFLDKTAFSCMDYYEFASDTWVSCFWEHNFDGFFLGKIPLIRKLNLREIVNVKAVYGTISDKNNGTLGNPLSKNAVLLFPEGMKELKTPYVEVGFGIANIFRLLRVDFNWRLTHKRHEVAGAMVKVPHPMSVNVGFEVNF